MTFPFTNPKPLGWALFETLTSAQMTQANANAAAAADGSIWSDATGGINVLTPAGGSTQGNAGEVVFWDPVTKYFYSFGSGNESPDVGAPDPVIAGRRSRNGRLWFTVSVADSMLSMFGGNNRHAWAQNGTGTLLFGGNQGTGLTACYRRSTNGTTWTNQSSTAAANNHVKSMAWIPFLSTFIAGFENGAIETSPTGVTWTNQTVPNADQRLGIATNGSIVVVGCGGSPNFITSTNGTAWTQRTGVLGGVFHVIYSPYWGKFFAYVSSGIASSSDGITWSSAGLTLPSAFINDFQTVPLCQFGRVIYLYNHNSTFNSCVLTYSLDGCQTWRVAEDVANAAVGTMADSPHGQLVMTDNAASRGHHTTFRPGTP